MSILDTTIVAVALATLGRDFHVSVTTIQWVATGYLLALAMVTPVTGWAVDRFGAKLIWMTSLSLFIVGSSLCGLAWSANSLIAFRVLQGIGGGMLLPVGQSILARAAGPQRMGRVMSIIGVPMVLGPIMGPVIGGLIVSNFSWRWIFYINVPIGIVTLILSQRWLPKFDSDERFPSAFDTLGFCLLSPGLAAIVYALSEVGVTGSYTGAPVIISFVLGIVLMTAFILHALHVKNPLLELHLFKHRNFAIANVCIFVIGATLFGSMFLLPLYYQMARGQEAWVAGLLMAPQGIGAACIMRWAGSVTDRVGPRRVVPAGILLMAAATIPLAFVTTSTNEAWLAVTLFVRGLGLGLSMMPVTAAAYFDLNHAEIPKASTVMNIVRLIGGSVATALFAVVLERQIVRQPRAPRRPRPAAAPASSAPPAGCRRRRRSGGRGVRPHVLVVGGRHPDRLHPDAVPAQPRRQRLRPRRRTRPDGADAGSRRRRSRHRGRGAPRRRGDARLSGSDPTRSGRVADPGRLAAVLAAAGSSPRRTRRASSSRRPAVTRRAAGRSSSGAWPASPWPGSRVARPSTASTCGSTPASTSPAGRASRWPTASAARLPARGSAIDLCTGSGALAAGPPARPGPMPGSSPPTSTAAPSPAPGPTASRPTRATSSPPCRPTLRAPDRRGRRRRALRPLARAPPAPPRHARSSRTPPTTTAVPTAPRLLRRVVDRRAALPASGRRAAARARRRTGRRCCAPLLERLGYASVETWADDGRRPAGPGATGPTARPLR